MRVSVRIYDCTVFRKKKGIGMVATAFFFTVTTTQNSKSFILNRAALTSKEKMRADGTEATSEIF
jgi:hypothetical protein